MNYVTIGDMAQSFQFRSHNSQLQRSLQTLTAEMTSGTRADLAAAVSGDFRALAGIDRSLGALQAFRTATSEAALLTASIQGALDATTRIVTDIAPGLLSAGINGSSTLVDTAAHDARQKFDAVVAALNTRIADRYLLSGAATDAKPIAGSQAILDALAPVIAGQVTAQGVVDAVAAFFDAPAGGGGYLDTIYGGSAAPLAAFRIAPGDQAGLELTAADPAIRDTLEALSLAALVADGALAGDRTGRALVLRRSGEGLLAAGDALTAAQARVGTAEARIEAAATRNAAEASMLGIERSRIVAADPFETATALEAVQTQIETLYNITARLSRLSLADFLR
ncbi:MAG: flagellar biosynthesis protein FlgL [Alphaproteobacteria bacterium HGW-Alphaproteobacteria-6]|nr:MAG: flagellar biosynthesis protein FlgL [Alphaproteobacteria bacterium HGW-Alphaproteobacteria-6]